MTAPTPHQAAPGAAALSARQAAAQLGVNEKTVRRWIERGDLAATKDASGSYRIDPDELARHRAAPAAPVPHQDAAPAADRAADSAAPTMPQAAPQAAPVDLGPLAELIADLTRRNERLTEAAAVWQVRAIQAEERLKQLGAGEDTLNKSRQIQGEAIGADQGAETSPGSAPQRGVQRSWWRFWRRSRET